MITIERAYVGYKVKFSPGVSGWRGFSVNAQTTDELHAAIAHWFDGHMENYPAENCPVCTKVLADQKKRNRKGEV